MASVIVTRFYGDKQGEPIVEPLASAENVLVARGKREIDAKSLDGLERELQVPYIEDLSIGDIVRIEEQYSGVNMVGKVSSFDHVFADGTQLTNLVIRGVIK